RIDFVFKFLKSCITILQTICILQFPVKCVQFFVRDIKRDAPIIEASPGKSDSPTKLRTGPTRKPYVGRALVNHETPASRRQVRWRTESDGHGYIGGRVENI